MQLTQNALPVKCIDLPAFAKAKKLPKKQEEASNMLQISTFRFTINSIVLLSFIIIFSTLSNAQSSSCQPAATTFTAVGDGSSYEWTFTAAGNLEAATAQCTKNLQTDIKAKIGACNTFCNARGCNAQIKVERNQCRSGTSQANCKPYDYIIFDPFGWLPLPSEVPTGVTIPSTLCVVHDTSNIACACVGDNEVSLDD
jgi:hypothetical protein